MFTTASPNDCFSAELVFLEYFLPSLIGAASLLGNVLRFFLALSLPLRGGCSSGLNSLQYSTRC